MPTDRIARERIKGLRDLMDQRFAAAEGALQIALGEREKAMLKAEAASDRRLEGMNEFRQTLSDQAATLVGRAEFNARIDSIVEAVNRLDKQGSAASGRGAGAAALWGWIVGAAGLVLAAGAYFRG